MAIGQLKFIFMIHKRPSATDITSETTQETLESQSLTQKKSYIGHGSSDPRLL